MPLLFFFLLFFHLVVCLFQAGYNPDQGQSKQIREEQTNPVEPSPRALVDLKIVSVPGEVEGDWGQREKQAPTSLLLLLTLHERAHRQPFIDSL